MVFKAALVLAVAALYVADAKDVTCVSGKKRAKVTINDGDSFLFKSQNPYQGRQNCRVNYKLGASCPSASVSCSTFNVIGKNDCSKPDFLKVISKREVLGAFCNGNKPEGTMEIDSNFSLFFKSNKKKHGQFKCTVACGSGPATTSPPAFTTSAPTGNVTGSTGATNATTPVPTTLSPTNATTTTVANTTTTATTTPATTTTTPTTTTTATTTTTEGPTCRNCTSSNGKQCVFPFIYGDKEFTSCTFEYNSAAEPWCSTMVSNGGFHMSGVGEWGSCDSSCPQEGGDGLPACQNLSAKPYANVSSSISDTCAAFHTRTNKNIYFYGNSYTYQNDLPAMIRNLASAAGFSATTQQRTPGGAPLSTHADAGLPQGDWDVVVIQGQSQEPAFTPTMIYNSQLPSTQRIVANIRANNPCTMPVFFQTWGRLNGDQQNCQYYSTICTYDGMQDRLTDSYSTFAYVNQPAKVSPAGEAFRLHGNRGVLYSGDGSHPSAAGTYLTACTFLETIWGVSCVGNSYKPVSDADNLQRLAHAAVQNNDYSWPQPGAAPPCPACIG